MSILEPIKPPRTDDNKEMGKFLREVAIRLSFHVYAGDPNSHIVPRWLGDWCFDTSNTEWYRSTGTTSADWELTT